MLLSDITVAYEKSITTLTTPSDLPDILPTDDPNTLHVMNKYMSLKVMVRRNTAVGNMVKKYATKRQGSITPHTLTKKIYFIIVMGFTEQIQSQGIASWNINILCH